MHGRVTHMLLSLEVWTAARHARLVAWHAPSSPLASSRALLRHLATTSTLSSISSCHAACHPGTQQLAHQAHPPIVTRAALLATRHYATVQRANSTLGAATLKPRPSTPTPADQAARGGWTSRDVLNTANLLSLSRLLSGPGTSTLHAHQHSNCTVC